MGRPAFQPTERERSLVRDLSSAGCSLNQISRELGISRQTVAKAFTKELETCASAKNKRARPNVGAAVDAEVDADVTAVEYLENLLRDPAASQARRDKAAELLLKYGSPEHGRPIGKRAATAARVQEISKSGSKYAAPPAPRLLKEQP